MRIEVDGAHSGIRFSSCHFIPGHEKCGRLHGHSYIIRMAVDGDIGPNGMVMDFMVLKKALRGMVDELDHRILLPSRSRELELVQDELSVQVLSRGKRYVFPAEDVYLMDLENTTAEDMSQMLLLRLLESVDFPPGVHTVSIGLDEERGQTAWASRRLRE
ncbi:MAG: 6-carboxytetrahydropterin synthase [Candidatus Methanomethylophilaceae archaeon]|nr:6-carboxytetrahydropterin synthase [Candidatus Methanomethylophilaceae archaeon]